MPPPKILIADDSPLVLRMLEKMLQKAGYETVTAKDGLEAVERVYSEDVSLILLDVMMPRMDGHQVCRLLKTEPTTRDIPVVILTSKREAEHRFWSRELGADHHMTKDTDPQKIVDLVRSVVGSEAAPRPASEGPRPEGADVLARVNTLLDRKLLETTVLSEIGRVSCNIASFEQSFGEVMRVMSHVVDYVLAGMAFVDQDDLDVFLLLQRPAATKVVEEAKARLLEAVARGRVGAPFAKVQAHVFGPNDPDGGSEEASLGGFASFPVETGGRLAGLLVVCGKEAGRLGAETVALLNRAANQAYIVLENCRLFDRVKNLSLRDSLTGLSNHHHTLDLVALEFSRARRYEAGVGLAMVDVDHFKKINDEHGHLAGDAVLRDLARIMRDSLRNIDVIGRYGGDEFLVLLPHTTYDETLQTGERIRAAVADHSFRVGPREIAVTVSVGVTAYPREGIDTPAALVNAADSALYRAKESGRNRVV